MTYFLYFGIYYKQVYIRFHLSSNSYISVDFCDIKVFITDSSQNHVKRQAYFSSSSSSCANQWWLSLLLSLNFIIFVIRLWIRHTNCYIIANLNIFKTVTVIKFHCNLLFIHISSYDLQYNTQTSFNHEASNTKWASSTSLCLWTRLTQWLFYLYII